MHGLEARYGNCIDFVYLDIDNPATRDAKVRFGYRAQPEMYLLDVDGSVVWKEFGFVSESELESKLKSVIVMP